MSAVIEIEGLTKDYEVGFWKKRQVRALDNLSLSVARGEIFGFLGGNGAGKTTTLKLLMRLIYPTAGRARILGRDINDVAMHQRIGYLPENPYFYDYLTARELLEYCAELFGYDKAERKRRAETMLSRVHLDEKAWDKQLRKFSKGMLQRTGLAQALVNDPEVVFLDEPMSGLDPIGRRQVRDLSDIEALCDRVAILKGGKLSAVGRLEDLRRASGEQNRVEIIAANTTADTLRGLLTLKDCAVTPAPSGARIEVADESDVDAALVALRQANARLVSVQPARQSLEDLFVQNI
jgi:ABC-2 type transport system ATP-binding protein